MLGYIDATLYGIPTGLTYIHGQANPTHHPEEQVDWRGLLVAQEQEAGREEDRAEEVQRQTPQARGLQGSEEVIHTTENLVIGHGYFSAETFLVLASVTLAMSL